jgi:hypothetical protein
LGDRPAIVHGNREASRFRVERCFQTDGARTENRNPLWLRLGHRALLAVQGKSKQWHADLADSTRMKRI